MWGVVVRIRGTISLIVILVKLTGYLLTPPVKLLEEFLSDTLVPTVYIVYILRQSCYKIVYGRFLYNTYMHVFSL